MHLLGEGLRLLSVTSLGVFVGGMLAEGCVLVPSWRAMPAAGFFAWYAANDRRLPAFFGPLTSITALLAVAAALASAWEGHPGSPAAVAAAILSLGVVSTFFLYFRGANATFASAAIGAERLPAELARWAAWHWWRTGLSVAALAAALSASGRP